MNHALLFTSLIEAELRAAQAEQREPNYQNVFMQQLQTHHLQDEHWLALTLSLLTFGLPASHASEVEALFRNRLNERIAQMNNQVKGLKEVASLLGQTRQSRTRPFILQLALPAGIPAATAQHIASAIISATPGCQITADTTGINQAIAEQLQQQHPDIALRFLSS